MEAATSLLSKAMETGEEEAKIPGVGGNKKDTRISRGGSLAESVK